MIKSRQDHETAWMGVGEGQISGSQRMKGQPKRVTSVDI